MLRRRELLVGKSELPAGYKRCKYLKKSGEAYIDTGVIPDKSMDFDVVFAVESTYKGSVYVFGSDNSYKIGFNLCSDMENSGGIRVCKFTATNLVETKILLKSGVQYSVQIRENQIIVDSKEFSRGSGSYICQFSLILFGTNRKGNAMVNKTYCQNLKVYSFSIAKDGEKIMNLVPALDKSGKPCMYDTVKKQPHYNAGSGEFLYELAA